MGGSVRLRRLTVALDLGASAFPFKSSTHRTPRGTGWSSNHRRDHCVSQERGETLACGVAVLSLGAVFGGADGEHRPRDAVREAAKNAFALVLGQCRGRAQIDAELHSRVRGVDALAAGTGGAGELLDQLVVWNDEAMGCAGARRYVQVIHATSLPQRPLDTDAGMCVALVGDLCVHAMRIVGKVDVWKWRVFDGSSVWLKRVPDGSSVLIWPPIPNAPGSPSCTTASGWSWRKLESVLTTTKSSRLYVMPNGPELMFPLAGRSRSSS